MAYSAKVLLDSISDAGVRLTTCELTIPRIVLAEFNTHRMLSRNSASSRAIPVKKMIERVMTDPFIPAKWGKNERGMQASEVLTEGEKQRAISAWLRARDAAVAIAQELGNPEGLNVHKQLTNRLIETWMWQTIICTATEWDNMRGLRVSPEAQPDFEIGARMLFEAFDASTPTHLNVGDWHMPLLPEMTSDEPFPVGDFNWCQISAARCARVSYLTHEGKRDPNEDMKLYARLLAGPHLSPLEHVAQALANPIAIGNFTGWLQLRKTIPSEAIHRRKT